MVRQRFIVLFRRWAFTVAHVLWPVLAFEVLVLVRQQFNYAPLGILDLIAGALTALLITAALCLVWAWGEWWWSKLQRVRGFVGELRRCSRSYWTPETVKTKKA